MRKRGTVGGTRRRWPAVLAMIGVVLLGCAVVATVLVVRPRVDPVQPVDALYVIGPAEGRIAEARQLMAAGEARTLIVTVSVNPKTGEVYTKDFCDPASWEVICVQPDPYATRGEAGVLARLVKEHGWSRVAVMTETSHVSRTRMWMDRCVPASVSVWPSDERRTPISWVGAIAYQSAAWVKAQVQRGCP
ncbi:hypothetical protein [Raineyella sp. W15-4]|uniref:YdcF family protein n=1 Tax=Raineyella sp. W15-4 TaxID=3081651 RepID=UPI002953E54E|nr:hypothetical protein [Raineyella sp. W15-4]WOQ16413.1 hypothetical protein R0145_14595 [Raineyella sp. W15-4]